MGKKKKKAKISSRKQRQDTKPIPPEEKDGGIKGLVDKKIVFAIFLFILSFLVYSPSLDSDFVWDDENIKKAGYSYTIAKIQENLTNPDRFHYRPILVLSLVIDRQFWDESPFGFHLSNIVFNSIVVMLFYCFSMLVLGEFRVSKREQIAFLSSLLFLLLPVHVEAVSFISARADLLCSIFFLIAFMCHILSYRQLLFFLLAAIGFYLSLLSKEVAIVFPIILIAYDLVRNRFVHRSNLIRYSIYFILFFGYVYYRSSMFENILESIMATLALPEIIDANGGSIESFYNKFLWISRIVLNSYLFYLTKLVFPYDLNPFIVNLPRGSFFTIASLLIISFLLFISLISIRKKERVTAFSIFWLLIWLAPAIGIAILGVAAAPYAERFLYIPSIGYCLLVGYWILEVGRRMNIEKIAWAFGLLLSISYLLIAIGGQSTWKNNVTLWSEATDRAPFVGTVYLNYGHALRLDGKIDEAINEYLKIFDSNVISNSRLRGDVANNLGIAYLEKGKIEVSENWFRKSIEYNPKGDRRFYYHMGYIYFLKGENLFKKNIYEPYYYKQSERFLKKLFEIHSTDGRDNLLLAHVYSRLGERKKAKEYAGEALKKGLIDPLAEQARDLIKRNK